MFLGVIRTVFKAPCYRRCAAKMKVSIPLNTAAALHTASSKHLQGATWARENTTTLGSYIAYRGLMSSKTRGLNILAGPFLKQPPGSGSRHCSSVGGAGSGGDGGEGGTSRCTPELEALFHGNEEFRAKINATSPGLLKVLASEVQRMYPHPLPRVT